ncbi:MAG TPA: HEXXH motif-containing putative peptide modification protein [Solirubrobacterales bacterium]|nr:HEXXH motif-containing putative peptide modification protein [Solirubrobacterales bacterium]
MSTLNKAKGQVELGPSVIRPTRVLSNAWAVARFGDRSLPTEPPPEAGEIRTAYLATLNQIQSHSFPGSMVGPELVLDFGDGPESEAALKELLDSDPLPPGWRFDERAEAEIRRDAEAALAEIAAIDPELHRNLSIVVAGFVFARRPKLEGGSISALTGPIWLDPADDWTIDTYVENMVHEYVHQCLFLDEMVNTIFAKFSIEEMSTPEALVTSTILKRRRPYDKAYHSAFVAHVLAQFYVLRGHDEKAREYLRSTRSTTDELLERSEFATANGLANMQELSAEVDAYLNRLG